MIYTTNLEMEWDGHAAYKVGSGLGVVAWLDAYSIKHKHCQTWAPHAFDWEASVSSAQNAKFGKFSRDLLWYHLQILAIISKPTKP